MSAGIDLSPEGLADLNSTAQVDDLSDALISASRRSTTST